VVDLFAELQLPDTTIAHRWAIHLGSAAAAPAVAAPTPAIEAQRVAGAPPRQPIPPHRELGREEIAILVKRGGRDFIASGDPAGARVVLQRAAESKDAEAALMLAATYDPVVLQELKVYGFAADVAMARGTRRRRNSARQRRRGVSRSWPARCAKPR
jgi:hypothetical protein